MPRLVIAVSLGELGFAAFGCDEKEVNIDSFTLAIGSCETNKF